MKIEEPTRVTEDRVGEATGVIFYSNDIGGALYFFESRSVPYQPAEGSGPVQVGFFDSDKNVYILEEGQETG